MIRNVDIATAHGSIDATLFTPENANAPLPPVILFTDIGGLRACFQSRAQMLADAGYAVLLPNVYYRSAPGQVVPRNKTFHDSDVMPILAGYARQLTPEALTVDFAALIHALDAAPECGSGGIGVVGYCMTGSFALRMASLHPDRIAAAAGFHSARLALKNDPASPARSVGSIKARVYLGHADRDPYLAADEIARLDGALAEAGVHFMTELYAGAPHGFTIEDASDPAANALHYKRLLTLFEETFLPR